MINTSQGGVCALISTHHPETRKLGPPTYAGQRIAICFNADGGQITVIFVGADLTTFTAVNTEGNYMALLTEAGQFVELVGAMVGGVLTWREVADPDGVLAGN